MISIIIINYNSLQYLFKNINSILNSDLNNIDYEIIIVDNNSKIKPNNNDFNKHNIKILFNNEFYPNRNLPQTYLFTWIAITTPIITLLLFIFGYLTYAKRFLKRFISIEEKQIFNDLWRGKKEITYRVTF